VYIPLSLQLVDLAPQPLDLQLLGLHLPMAREGLHRIGAELSDHRASQARQQIL
jgi:hypothetical protein